VCISSDIVTICVFTYHSVWERHGQEDI